jgi:hypothetical protein
MVMVTLRGQTDRCGVEVRELAQEVLQELLSLYLAA